MKREEVLQLERRHAAAEGHAKALASREIDLKAQLIQVATDIARNPPASAAYASRSQPRRAKADLRQQGARKQPQQRRSLCCWRTMTTFWTNFSSGGFIENIHLNYKFKRAF